MSKTYTLHLKNFRSIRDAKIDIAPITVVYGPSGTGKSSLMYGLLTLKNFLTNPAQNISSLFSYPTMSLGGFDEVVSNHANDDQISLSISASTPEGSSKFTLGIGKSDGQSIIDADLRPDMWKPFRLGLDIPFPYRANQSVPHQPVWHDFEATLTDPASSINFTWNGIALTCGDVPPVIHQQTLNWLTTANLPMELARSTGYAPLRRGFSKPVYGITNVTPFLGTDDEVSSMLATERFLEYEVSRHLEKVANRQLRTRYQIGGSVFNLDSVPRDEDVPVSMVNEGFGVNQIAYLLAVTLRSSTRLAVIEEPEIHLHPSLLRKLVHALVDIVSNNDKRIIVSTHSETFVLSLLAQIVRGKIGVDDVSFILSGKEDGESIFTKREATLQGQLEGGTTSFIESGFEDIAVFLGLELEDVRS